jgi:hypothetical protein
MHMFGSHGSFIYIICMCYAHRGYYLNPNTKMSVLNIGWP